MFMIRKLNYLILDAFIIWKHDNLQHILKTFDKTKVCQGSSRKLSNLKSSYGFKFVESCGMWRHSKCNIIIEKNTESGNNRLEILEIKK